MLTGARYRIDWGTALRVVDPPVPKDVIGVLGLTASSYLLERTKVLGHDPSSFMGILPEASLPGGISFCISYILSVVDISTLAGFA